MIRVQPFRTWHLEEIELQPAQANWTRYGTISYAQALATGTAFTAREDGRVLACAGVLPMERDVGSLWAFLSIAARRRLLRLGRMALRLCEVSGFARIVTSAEADFGAGCRFLELLGFKFVERIAGFGPDGRDHHFYARGF